MHRQVKTSDIISRRFGDFMTPLSRLQMRIKLTNARLRVTTDLYSCFKVLKKCKFDCLVNEILYIKQLTPSLNVQADSIRAKVFV